MSESFHNRIFNEDCLSGMRRLPAACVDLVVTDPPFAIDFRARRGNYNRTASRVLEGYNEIAAADYGQFTRAWLAEVKRLLKPDASAYVFSGWNNLKDILTALDELGYVTVNHLIWKYQFGVVTRRRYVSSHYHCLYVCLDDKLRRFYPFARFGPAERDADGRSLHYADKEDVWSVPREYWQGDHKTPTKLPAELIRKILAYSSVADDLVLDPFLGSGQVAVVSKELGRRYLGFEIVPEYWRFARQRLDSGLYRLPADSPQEG